MLIALLFYGYATGVFSSRQLERSTHDSVAFRFIAANVHPDHDTIATFRRRFLPQLRELFVQILQIAHQMNVLKLGSVSLDGSKVKANASKHKALSYDYATRLETKLKDEVAALLQKAEAADRADIPDGMNIPEELERREKRLAAIAQAKAEIEKRAAERHTREQAAYEKKVAARAEKEQKTGKRAKGKQPKPPKPDPNAKDQVNLTDEESRIMPVSGGGFEQGFNAQASVETTSKLIVAAHVTQQTNDKFELVPTLHDVTTVNVHEINRAKSLKLPTGSFVVFDRGYTDYGWYQALMDSWVFFVARLKDNALVEYFKKRPGRKSKGVTLDQVIALKGMKDKLRLVCFTAEDGNEYRFITNASHLPAATVAELYNERWQIELFFKWIMQNLKVKTFLGKSENGVLTQL